MVKPGATVIDVGITRLPNKKIVGDVDFDGVRMYMYVGHVIGCKLSHVSVLGHVIQSCYCHMIWSM